MNRNALGAIMATSVVVVVVILGFRSLGSPSTQRQMQGDLRIVQSLSTLAQRINQRWVRSGKALPADLSEFPDAVTRDPASGQEFTYRPESNNEYSLCAKFATDNRASAAHSSDSWPHPKGDYCFKFEAGQPVPSVPYY